MATNDKMDQAAGRAKQAAGDLTGDEDLKAEGEAQEAKGKLKDAIDNAAGKVQETADKLKDKLDEKK